MSKVFEKDAESLRIGRIQTKKEMPGTAFPTSQDALASKEALTEGTIKRGHKPLK